jgi:acetoin utilization protein AcuB
VNSHSPDVDSGFDGPAKVRDWMSEKPTSLGPNESIGFAMELMLWASVRHLPVVDNGQLLGIVSDRDLLAPRVASQIQQMGDRPVRECMTTDVETAHPDDDLRDASARMAAAGISALPVVEEGKLVGIITSTDILAERGRLVFKSGRGSVPSVATVMREDPIRVRPDPFACDRKRR